MTLQEIKEMPEVVEHIHESCFKAAQLLRYVTEMLERGDSCATILDVMKLVYETPKKRKP